MGTDVGIPWATTTKTSHTAEAKYALTSRYVLERKTGFELATLTLAKRKR